ncbi:uncharacterized protein LOC135496291 [Lineus longissimus]|uniref:uncharacterized protein LOC135496291 n=1 Tax=Lineus longissimus TaxID=88925 RepID=UPI002B4E0DA9
MELLIDNYQGAGIGIDSMTLLSSNMAVAKGTISRIRPLASGTSGGYSNHQPSGGYDLSASRNIQARMHITDGTQYKRNPRTGIFEYLRLIPDLPTNDCGCGSPFKNTEFPDGLPVMEDFTCTLYMRHAPVACKVYKRKCLASCAADVQYSGQKDSIFFWSRQVAAADEVGWDFVNLIMSSKMSFSNFCLEKSRYYRTMNPISAPFMNKGTFISWFFAWCSKMDIDFRAHVDP